ncbi:MAG: hypothetical protein HYR96_12390 [Deltaproteobacteria bacterium]|nr:hypothetical protein [Deltaproteobacteria bacterium]MBI3296003.1 hypothetical protein [Deltaproteobacteria bacterium]
MSSILKEKEKDQEASLALKRGKEAGMRTDNCWSRPLEYYYNMCSDMLYEWTLLNMALDREGRPFSNIRLG